jgi:hypothetical protein
VKKWGVNFGCCHFWHGLQSYLKEDPF